MAPTFSGCCGQPVRRKHRIVSKAVELPANPRVPQGVKLLYLGSGLQSLRGQQSGLVYHVSERRRWFMVSPDDVNLFLRRRDVIIAP
jgi:hypothetical protein